ncbi:MAG: YggS family pyridoxal phosphate-dependent enzyme [Clostridia bacterium]|nr:YggS family pyridoxal phosphate-dependent enzyme [Clostridia bacterium]MDD4145837.1 YggS family pyridoxal phosphate-dependent enzyme [Clostridia bacterium]MDD4665120.1 YggS family pyridoxal phosphate-dependent enzyme [Clostridia bacterium]
MIRNIDSIKSEIQKACTKVRRDPSEVKLLAVSKTFSVETIKAAYAAGQRLFGENRVQELCQKASLLPPDIEWHLIGTLQRNKVKDVVGKVALIHSVDSLPLAQEINKQALKRNLSVNILLQVNIAEEESKHGFALEEIAAKVKAMCQLPGIKIRGLMTIAPFTENPEEVRLVFRQLKMLAESLEKMRLPEVQMQELSMGMSGDFGVAVEEGATLVRIGSRIFGTRDM